MTDVISDGKTTVVWIPGPSGVANINGPTLAEIATGVNITAQITDDGLEGWTVDQARVGNTSLASVDETERFGRRKLSAPLLRLKSQGQTDPVVSSMSFGTMGHVLIRRGLANATPFAATQKCQVVPVECGEASFVKPEPNSLERVEVPFANHTPPAYHATVA